MSSRVGCVNDLAPSPHAATNKASVITRFVQPCLQCMDINQDLFRGFDSFWFFLFFLKDLLIYLSIY